MTTPPKRAYSALTRLLHADRLGGVEHGAIHKPLHVSAAFNYPSARDLVEVFQGNQAGHVYARQGNPTVNALEAKVTLLEDATGTATFATGMAAITAVFLALLRAGDHLVCTRFLFGNTNSLMQTLQALGVAVTFVDATAADNVRAAITPATRMVFVETIANPVTQVADLDGIGQVCKDAGLLYVVDSTLTTPLLMQGRDVAAGLVVHSLSKSIGGHGNALGGAVVDTGLFDWSGYANILPPYKKGPAQKWGLLQVRKKGLRDMGGTLRAEDAHRAAPAPRVRQRAGTGAVAGGPALDRPRPLSRPRKPRPARARGAPVQGRLRPAHELRAARGRRHPRVPRRAAAGHRLQPPG
jgi:O-acetylhomoserine (thiol)-lyase